MAKDRTLPLSEILKVCQLAHPHSIVQGKDYIYFSLSPSMDVVRLTQRAGDMLVEIYEARNEKNTIIGYCAFFKSIRGIKFAQNSEYGIAVYFSKARTYKQLDALFNDSKFRALKFGIKDYFFSVKWRANAAVDLIPTPI